jgi:hypothetical protein
MNGAVGGRRGMLVVNWGITAITGMEEKAGICGV